MIVTVFSWLLFFDLSLHVAVRFVEELSSWPIACAVLHVLLDAVFGVPFPVSVLGGIYSD